MLITIPRVLDAAEALAFRERLDGAAWQDGAATAGSIASRVKRNQQLDDSSEVSRQLGNQILRRLSVLPTFIAAALPDRIYPPKFNRYHDGGAYGAHIDGSLMQVPGSAVTLRTDLSATLFLSAPDDYDGGELTVVTAFGEQRVKLGPGDMLLYPSTSLHHVTPVTRGVRVAAFFWIQSMVRDNAQRALLYELDRSVQVLTAELGTAHDEVVRLSGLYHNLIRQWATT